MSPYAPPIKSVIITQTENNLSREIPLPEPTRKGSNELIQGWSLGSMGSGADIPLDEPLCEVEIGIYPASNHVILWGTVPKGAKLPEIALVDHPQATLAQAEEGRLYFRFDRSALRIGRHVLRLGS